MPDPLRKTVSASQMAALFGVSPWETKFLLWHWFANGAELPEKDEDERMGWGKRLQPVILKAAAEEHNFEVTLNADDTYHRHPEYPIGCTVDAIGFNPSRGEGVIEAKNVDWFQWKDKWSETDVPAYYQLQVRSQMLTRDMKWGLIPCFVGGNQMQYYWFERDERIDNEMLETVEAFFASLRHGDEPEPFGTAPEYDFLKVRKRESKTVELPDSYTAWMTAREYLYWQGQQSTGKKIVEGHKAKFLSWADGGDTIRVHDHIIKINTASNGAVRIDVKLYPSEGEPPRPPGDDVYFG